MKIPTGIKTFGDLSMRGDCPSETLEQITFFNKIRKKYPNTHGALVFHVRNEGKRRYDQMAKQKAEGFVTGVPDIFIPGCPSFVCELKRQDHTKCKISKKQIEYLYIAKSLGSWVCIAFGYEAALKAFEAWLQIQH